MLEKMIASTKSKPNVIGRSGLLPLVLDILLQSDDKVEYLLELVEEITFVVTLTTYESYAPKLFQYVVNILTDVQFEVNAMEANRTV